MLLATLVAAIVTALVAGLLVPILRRHAIDVPTQRSSHTDPTPRGGGIALIAGVAAGAATLGRPDTAWWAIFATAGILAALGLADDLRGLPPLPRLVVQLTAPIPAVWWLISETDRAGAIAVLATCLGVIWMAGFVNAFNFMDGINGIAAVALVVAGASQAVAGRAGDLPMLEWAGLVGVGAAAGFLPWNFPTARLFMGDVGSYFVGAWLGGLMVFGITRGIHPLAMLAPATLFVCDTAVTLVRRYRRREQVTRAHREHVYQRAVAAGWSHTLTTAVYGALSALICVAGFAWLGDEVWLRVGSCVVAAAAVAAYFSLPRVAGRRSAG